MNALVSRRGVWLGDTIGPGEWGSVDTERDHTASVKADPENPVGPVSARRFTRDSL